jgi:hypothetical protein
MDISYGYLSYGYEYSFRTMDRLWDILSYGYFELGILTSDILSLRYS